MQTTRRTRRIWSASTIALALAACSEGNGPGSGGLGIAVEAPGEHVVVGMVDGTGWVAVRGTIAQVGRLERLTWRVDQQPERDADVAASGTFAFDATPLAPGRHELRLRAYDRSGDAHAGPVITVDVVPAIREITLPDEADYGFPTAINERGDVTGYWLSDESPRWHAFVHRDGTMHALGAGHWRAVAMDANESGDVVGYAITDEVTQTERALLWRGATETPLFTEEGGAAGINDDGVIVGRIFTDDGPPRGFVLRGGQRTIFGQQGRLTVGVDVNALGDVVGNSLGQLGDRHAFVISGGTTRQLGGLGGQQTAAAAMNGAGVVVGYSEVEDFTTFRAFRDRSGDVRALRTNDLRDLASYANAINDRGVVVGEMITPISEHWAFIAVGDEMLAIEELIPDGPLLFAAFGINERGEIAVFGLSSAGALVPMIVALPGGPEAVTSAPLEAGAVLDRRRHGDDVSAALHIERTRRTRCGQVDCRETRHRLDRARSDTRP